MDFTRVVKINSNINLGFQIAVGDIINIIGILVNIGIAIYIASVVQNRLTNKRTLKDYFINEVKEIEDEYKKFYNSLLKGQIKPQKVLEWFKSINIRTAATSSILHEKFRIDKNIMKNYRSNLLNLITESECYTNNYNSQSFTPDSDLKNLISIYHNRNNRVFQDLIVSINDA